MSAEAAVGRLRQNPMLAVLIVEDDALLALDLEGTVIELGHRVCATADTASGAVKAAEAHHPDLILMDFNLADGSGGAEAAESIRRTNAVPIVFVTAQSHASCLARMDRISRSLIVPKPHNPRMIASAIVQAQAA